MKSSRNIIYDRSNAVRYALKYALNPNPDYRYFPLVGESAGDCANFVSQCLHAGGAPMNYNSQNQWWYNNKGTKNTSDDTWSISWATAHSLFWYLRINEYDNLLGLKGSITSNLNSLNIGDLMFLRDNKGLIFHSAIITSFSQGIPLISQHSFEALNIPYTQTWGGGKTIFLKITS